MSFKLAIHSWFPGDVIVCRSRTWPSAHICSHYSMTTWTFAQSLGCFEMTSHKTSIKLGIYTTDLQTFKQQQLTEITVQYRTWVPLVAHIVTVQPVSLQLLQTSHKLFNSAIPPLKVRVLISSFTLVLLGNSLLPHFFIQSKRHIFNPATHLLSTSRQPTRHQCFDGDADIDVTLIPDKPILAKL